MLSRISRRPFKGIAQELDWPDNITGEVIVWWYGGIMKNYRAASQPLVAVSFRKIDSDGTLGKFLKIPPRALTNLGQLSVGSIWKDGTCRAEAFFETVKFKVDFSKDAWKIVSNWDAKEKGGHRPISPNDYQLEYSNDKNWLIEFYTSDQQRLLVPCLEFFLRCYGCSKEVKRVLATYPWEDATRRFFAAFDAQSASGQWPIKLNPRMHNGDATFLAHAFYDEYTKRIAKAIYSQIEAEFQINQKIAFVKVPPWFQGLAEIKVKGLWIDNGKSFLGLKVVGCSEPTGVPILLDRENTNIVDQKAEDAEGDLLWTGASTRKLKKPEEIALTGNIEPDNGAASIEVYDSDFIILGESRVVIRVQGSKSETTRGKSVDSGEPGVFASGESYGSGKGVGYVSICARPVMESQGVLRDVWEALIYLHRSKPQLVSSVEWFTFETGFVSNQDPQLIALQPFDEDNDDIETGIKNWVYFDKEAKTLRGVLVVRVILLEGRPVYFFEVQRKFRKKREDDGSLKDSEESFKGLVFTLEEEGDFDDWLRILLSRVRDVKGIIKELIGECPGNASTFKHAPAKEEKVSCKAAVLNAFRKVGVLAYWGI